ncbi:MAG: hypothetical protein JWO52_5425 [Gammaproteobacteria bacterium]|jgi:hypothetical protein|nr:hypothetical protein [Gammaproteobacteria bacterium]
MMQAWSGHVYGLKAGPDDQESVYDETSAHTDKSRGFVTALPK